MSVPLEPETYARLLRKVRPSPIVLRDCYVRCLTDSLDAQIVIVDEPLGMSNVTRISSFKARLRQDYQARLLKVGDQTDVLVIRAGYEMEISADEDLPDEFIELYSDRQLHLYARPYFREFVSSMAARSNFVATPLDPLFLPAPATEQPPLPVGNDSDASE